MATKDRPVSADMGDGPAEDPVEAWRRKATQTYTWVLSGVLLLFVILALLHPALQARHKALTVAAWLLTLAAALLRRIPFRARVLLTVLSSWVFAAAMLDRGGVFLNVRLPLATIPVLVFVLAGIRLGVAVGLLNATLLALAFLATERGWLPQAPPPWQEGEWVIQAIGTTALMLPLLLMVAWFVHRLTALLRREQAVAGRLQTEAAERERLEGEVLDAGERESRRIGAELHDGVCQDLTGLSLRGKRAQKALEAAGRPEAEDLRGIVEGLGEAIGEVHGLSRRLSPGRLTGRDLAGALDDLVRRTAEVSDARVTFRSAGDGSALDPRVTLQLYRIAQEALSNAVRHAGASHIEVLLSHDRGPTMLRVDDDGRGMPADSGDTGGLGLDTMLWRASRAGALLLVGPRPGGGTRVECWMPVEPAERGGLDGA